MAVANGPGAARGFRSQCRSESNATKRSIEAPAGDLVQARPPSRPAGRDGEDGIRNDPVRPRWGLGTRSDPGEPRSPVVVRVSAGSAAATAGVVVGDRVTAVAGVPLESQADMVARLAAAAARVALDLERKGRLVRVEMQAPDSTD
ncbi:MAG: PDZ domain-containing protein [Planctomycetia bacterium]